MKMQKPCQYNVLTGFSVVGAIGFEPMTPCL
jgi:hypothetical protein